jgi:glutathione S-transferase
MSITVPVLWHLKASHYNEKARWGLDHKRVPHLRRAAVPGRHAEVAERLSGGRTLPVLLAGTRAIGDSARIIDYLERRRPEPPLYPRDPAERRRALALQQFFDDEFGPQIRLLVIHHMLASSRLLLGAFVPEPMSCGRAAT